MLAVGKYNTTSSNRPWFQEASKNVSKNVRKSKTNSVVINPIFEEYANLSHDTFWQNIFKNASFDIFPNKFGFKDGTLFYHKGKRNISLDLNYNDKLASMNSIKTFFLETGGISTNQISSTQEIRPIINNKPTIIKWSELNNKEKIIKLHLFLIRFAKSNELNTKEFKHLEGVINLAYTLNLFNDKNVIMDDFKIIKLAGLKFYKGTKFPYLETLRTYNSSKDKAKKTSVNKKKTKLNFISLWEKYIDCWASNQKVRSKDLNTTDRTSTG